MRDLAGLPLVEATQALDEGRVLLDGLPYQWEADEMAFWLREPPEEPGEVAHERDRVRFQVRPAGYVPPGAECSGRGTSGPPV